MKYKSTSPGSINRFAEDSEIPASANLKTEDGSCSDGLDSSANHHPTAGSEPYTLRTVAKMAKRHPDSLTEGGLRHLIFHCGDQMEKAGVLVRVGRRRLLVDPPFLDWLRAGNARRIGGKK